MMKMWRLSHADVCDYGEKQTMYHLMTCGDAPNCTWTDMAIHVQLSFKVGSVTEVDKIPSVFSDHL